MSLSKIGVRTKVLHILQHAPAPMTVKQLTERIGLENLEKFAKNKERTALQQIEAARTRVKRIVEDLEEENTVTRIAGRPFKFKFQGAADSMWLLQQLLSIDDSISARLPTNAQRSIDSIPKVRSKKQQSVTTWQQKVFIARAGFTGKPEIDSNCARIIYTALEQNQYLALDYVTAKGEYKKLLVFPWGLIFKGDACYLVANAHDGTWEKPVLYALHRITDATVTPDVFHGKGQPPSPDAFHRFCQEHKVDVFPKNTDRDISLVIRVRADTCTLKETPLADDQVIEKLDDQWLRVKATVRHCAELRKFVLGYAGAIVVEQPAAFRDEIKQSLQEHLAAYND